MGQPVGAAVHVSPATAQGYYGHQYQPQNPPGYGERAEDPMCMAVIACLCCCWLIGICAILKSVEVQAANARGDFALAHAKRKEAMMWIYITVCVGLSVFIVNVIMRSSAQ